jgi:hypothetical protein
MFDELVGEEGDDGKPSKTLEATLNGLAAILTEDKGEIKNGDLKASESPGNVLLILLMQVLHQGLH